MASDQQKKILVIEDDEDIRKVVGTRLNRAGYQTTIASDGMDGLRRFYGDRPDLVVLESPCPSWTVGKSWNAYGKFRMFQSKAFGKKIRELKDLGRSYEGPREYWPSSHWHKPLFRSVDLAAIENRWRLFFLEDIS